MEIRVGGKFRLIEQINQGAHAEIWKAINILDNSFYAVKIERDRKKKDQTVREAKVYDALKGTPGFCKVWWYGFEGKDSVIVLDLMAKSVEDMVRDVKALPLEFVAKVAVDMIDKISFLHSRNIIHRDIKPDDIMVKDEGSDELFLIDFSLARTFKDSQGRHIPYAEGKPFLGTARYASINTHLGIPQTRRDDLECLGYSLLYMLRGSLPWQGVRAFTKKEKYQKLTEKKLSMIIEVLCEGLPIQFTQYFQYVRALKFDERPEYYYLRDLFQGFIINQEITNNHTEPE